MSRSKMNKSARVALYARVSTANHGQDPETQLVELRRVAEQRGWNIVEEYVDTGISGTKQSRPALDKLMQDVRAGKLDVVVVARFDRFARSVAHLLAALEEFRTLNVQFVSLAEAIDTTTPIGRMVFTVVAAVAELEREIIRERVLAGVRRAQQSGKRCGRPRVELDLRPAMAMLRERHGLKAISTAMGVNRATLRARLVEAGHWPPKRGGNKAASPRPS